MTELAPVLVVGFDYLAGSGFLRLLGEPAPDCAETTPPPDPIEAFIAHFMGDRHMVTASLVAASWRSALWIASDGPDAAREARSALTYLLGAPRQGASAAAR